MLHRELLRCGISAALLGFVLSMELIGMAVGSIMLGMIANRCGRSPTILACSSPMALGLALSGNANSIEGLSAYRFLTGLGIGDKLAAVNAMAAEFANARWRSFCVVVMACGYPLGAIIGGSIASLLLATYEWPVVFWLGPIVAGAMFEAGYSLSVVALAMALRSLVALVTLLFLPTHPAS